MATSIKLKSSKRPRLKERGNTSKDLPNNLAAQVFWVRQRAFWWQSLPAWIIRNDMKRTKHDGSASRHPVLPHLRFPMYGRGTACLPMRSQELPDCCVHSPSYVPNVIILPRADLSSRLVPAFQDHLHRKMTPSPALLTAGSVRTIK